MAIVEISIVPLGTASTSLSSYVAKCHERLKNSNLNYQLTPMGTIIEGDLVEIMSCINDMHEVPFAAGASRVMTNIKIDDRRDQHATMEQKVQSVNSKL
ncbi:MTH1187 family thiamine-binding protein [Vallitalea okinawensis]|uniref:MTH1187 family thiamine-binding protein n=1 Tax=Vallitalea okinawensis TaxID=2078660 RepID=UPI000CFB3021|nr:MTH1187 family thiamine-binding protein [Vallitalea okinawensis]